MNEDSNESQSDRQISAAERFDEFIREAEIGGDMPEEVSQITAGVQGFAVDSTTLQWRT